MKIMNQLARYLIATSLVSILPLAPAATRTWNGGGANNFWNAAANWSGTLPMTGDDLVFPGGAAVDTTSLNNTNDFAASMVFSSITISGTNYILGGNAIALTNGINHTSSGTNTVALDVRLDAHSAFSSTIEAAKLLLTGNVNVNGFNLALDASGVVEVAGVISGTGNVTKTGTGTLIFSGGSANTYAGFTFVNVGTLLLNKSPGVNAIPTTLVIGDGVGGADADVVRLQANMQLHNFASVQINSSGLLDLNGFPEITGAPSGTGRVHVNGSSFSANTLPGQTIFDGIISGSGNLVQIGIGTWILNGANTFTGFSTANATLLVNGTFPVNAVTVYGTLGGTGQVGHVFVADTGQLAPGLSPGRLTTSNLTFYPTSTYRVELNGSTPGTGYDQLKVNGDVDLGGGVLEVTLEFNPVGGESFTIIDNDGSDAVAGSFDGLPEGVSFMADGSLFDITYAGGDGNDVVITLLQALQPTLTIGASLSNAVISWAPDTGTNWLLQQTAVLSPATWTNSPSGSTNPIVVPAALPTKLYRLFKP